MAHPFPAGSSTVNGISPPAAQAMVKLERVFIDYLNMLPQEHQPKTWQMIESFSMHWQRTGIIAAYHSFAFPDEVVMTARIFERHLRSLPGPHAVDLELRKLGGCRPQNVQHLPCITSDTLPLKDLMKTQPTHRYQPIFRSFEHQQALKEEYDQLNDKKNAMAAPACQDFPNDIEGQHRLLKVLFEAIIDCSKAEERPRLLVKNSKKRKLAEMEQATGNDGAADSGGRQWGENTYIKRIMAATDVEIQFIAWNLLFRIRDAQTGVVGIGPWATNWKYNPFDSFMDRFWHVVDVCRRSKSAVVSMMTANDIFTKRLAAGPLKEIGQKRQNKTTNLLRDKQNKAALHCQRKGWVKMDHEGHMLDAEGVRIDPSPPSTPPRPIMKRTEDFVDSENVPGARFRTLGQAPSAFYHQGRDDYATPFTAEFRTSDMFSAAARGSLQSKEGM